MKTKLKTQRGFTLIEILVVILIIGVMVSLVMLSIRTDPADSVKEEAQRFVTLVSLAQQEALLYSKEMGIEIASDGYQFIEKKDGKWALYEDKILRPRELPEVVRTELTIEDNQINVSSRGDDQIAPRIYLWSTGEMTPFTMMFLSDADDIEISISGSINGNVQFVE